MSREDPTARMLRRQVAVDRTDRAIAEAWEQIKRADDLLERLRMRRIRSPSQDLSPAG